MARRLSNLVMSLPKFGHVAGKIIATARTSRNPCMLFGARLINQVPNSNEALSSDSTGPGVTADGHHDNKAYSTATQEVKDKAREVGSEISAKAEGMGKKAKQAIQDAWDSTKNSAHSAADTVLSKAQDTADSLKQNVDSLKRSFDDDNSSSSN